MNSDVARDIEDQLISEIDPKKLSAVFAELMARRREDLLDYFSKAEAAKIMNTPAPPALGPQDQEYVREVLVTVGYRAGDPAAHKLMELRKAASPSIAKL